VSGGSPEQRPEWYRLSAPISYAERLRAPCSFSTSKTTRAARSRQIDTYLTRLDELGKPFRCYRSDAGHGSLVEHLRQAAVEVTVTREVLGTLSAV
jgi:hypothetical protein